MTDGNETIRTISALEGRECVRTADFSIIAAMKVSLANGRNVTLVVPAPGSRVCVRNRPKLTL